MSSIVVLDHRFFWDTRTFNILNKVYNDTTDSVMVPNNNKQEPGGITKNSDVTDDEGPK